jgi:phosphoribosyl-ATP pyrophosphohydrolase
VALAAVTRDAAGCAEETADLLYHLTVLMQDRGYSWEDVMAVLRKRHAG